MYKNQLYNQNMWWKSTQEINNDQKITEAHNQKFFWRPVLLDAINLQEPGIYTLRGPRQVGKSTCLKLLIQDLLIKVKVDPARVMFYSSEDLETFKDLAGMLNNYFDILGTQADTNALIYIFIDEISFIKNWERGIKLLYERGKLKNVFIMLSGSNSYDLHHQAERLPGRRGSDPYPDKVFLPLSFHEFLSMTNVPLAQKLPVFSLEEALVDLSKLKQLGNLMVYSEDLVNYYNIYKITGGFLKVINNFFQQNKIPPVIYETYLQWIRGDISKLKRSEKTSREILGELVLSLVDRLEWQGIARKLGIDSHKTVADYVGIFEDFFILKTLYQIDPHKKIPRVKKMKKAYFLDSFIFWALWSWFEKISDAYNFSRIKSVEVEPKLIEMFIAAGLFRLDSHDWLSSRVFFWYGQKEIDFVIQNNLGKLVPIEVKYQNSIDRKDFYTMVKAGFKDGVVISKNTFQVYDDCYYVIPYYLWGIMQ